jgi:ParB family chromosome partitioning protein
MDPAALETLARSIEQSGLMQPVVVRALAGEAGRYELIAGERRWRAMDRLGKLEIPAIIQVVDDRQAAELSLIENLQREDLNPLEEAQGIQRLIDEFNFTHEQAAGSVGRSRSAVSNLLRLLNLAKPVQGMLMAGDLDMGHARALLAVDSATQITLANQIVGRRLSVREAEKLVVRTTTGQDASKSGKNKEKSRDLERLEEELSDEMATTVSIKVGARNKGEMVIAFAGLDQLDGIIARLRGK